MKITKKQLKRIVREAMDYDPLGDAGVPHVGVGPKYALAFVDRCRTGSHGNEKDAKTRAGIRCATNSTKV
jgi:hypothetical protein